MGLYVDDKSKIHFTTRIKSIVENKAGNFLVLEESHFNPGHFPMPSDKGYINGKKVLEVIVKDGVVMHLVDSYAGFTINMPVNCEIDAETRVDYMVQDSAYHLLSSIIYENFNARSSLISTDNEKSEIYVDQELKQRDIYSIENKSNDCIKKDYTLIKEISKEENLSKQYIKIGKFKSIDCPYIHVETLKEIQIIKIKKAVHYNGGTKISYIAGERLIKFLRDRDIVIKNIEKECDAYLDEVAFKIRLLKEKNNEYKDKYKQLLNESSAYIANSYSEDFIIEKTNWTPDLIKEVGRKLSERHKVIVFYNISSFKVFIFTNESIKIDEIVDSKKAFSKEKNYLSKILNLNYAEISFRNSLELKRFVSSIYDKILKYSKK